MSILFKRLVATAVVIIAGIGTTPSAPNRLLGRWECYRQADRAKLTSCLLSIEFFPDGTLVQKNYYGGEIEVRAAYSAKGNRINVKSETGESWHFGFKFLANGDLVLSKRPWDWRGWFTTDSNRVPKNHGCPGLLIEKQ